jgi:two-component system, LuxR family, sensor kinase FixL
MHETGRAELQRRLQPREVSIGAERLWLEHFDASLATEYNLSPVAHVTLDRNGCICRLNLAAANLLKGDKFQLRNVPFLAFVERSYCRAFLDHLAACIQFRKKVSSELILASHTRSGAPVELQSVPGVDQPEGALICRTAIISKSERESAPRALSGDRQYYAELFELSPDAILVQVDGKIASANPGAVKLFGAGSVNELLGKGFFEIVHPDYHQTVRERIERIRQGESELPIVEEKFVRTDGRSVAVNVMSRPAVFQGKPAILVLARDVSERLELEEDLHRAEDLSAQILANNSIATAIISLETERVLKANAIFCTLTGLDQSKIVGRSLSEVGWRLTTNQQDDIIKNLGPQSAIHNREAQVRRPDGSVTDVLASAKTIQFSGEQCVLLMVQDLTDLQRLKQDVVAISEEEQKRFSRDLHDSHCQDLTAIAFFAETIAAGLDSKDTESAGQIRVLGDMVRKSAENVHSLAAGLSSQQIEQSGLAAALKDLASRTGQRFGLVCTAKVDRTCRFRDTVSAVHIYRIAQEATSNAARHGHAKRIDIKLRLEDDLGILQIEDDGQGFSIEKKPNGLGLRTMEYRATVIKGALNIDSKPGIGTVVTCSFPSLAAK